MNYLAGLVSICCKKPVKPGVRKLDGGRYPKCTECKKSCTAEPPEKIEEQDPSDNVEIPEPEAEIEM